MKQPPLLMWKDLFFVTEMGDNNIDETIPLGSLD